MCCIRRYRLDADSPCAMRDHGQKDRRRQLEKAVSQGNKAVVKVTLLAICFYSSASGEHIRLILTSEKRYPCRRAQEEADLLSILFIPEGPQHSGGASARHREGYHIISKFLSETGLQAAFHRSPDRRLLIFHAGWLGR